MPALQEGMAEGRREVATITSNPAEPTFDNTVVALERIRRFTGQGYVRTVQPEQRRNHA